VFSGAPCVEQLQGQRKGGEEVHAMLDMNRLVWRDYT
jgi:hypothetical protein